MHDFLIQVHWTTVGLLVAGNLFFAVLSAKFFLAYRMAANYIQTVMHDG